MTVTEFAVLNLHSSHTRSALASNEAHSECLKTVSSQPGCLGVTWGVLEEDDKVLVWMVEWEKLQHHTEVFMKSPAYKPFFDRFTTLLDSSSPIKIMQHYNLSPTPSSLAKDSTKPTFELFVPKIKQGSSYDQLEKSFQPLLAKWDKRQNRRAAIARAVDTKRGEQEQDKVLLVVPWKSSKEHEEGKKEEIFIKVLEQARKCWDGVELYAHVNVTGGRD